MKPILLSLAAAAATLLPAASPVAYTLTPNSTFSVFSPAGAELTPIGSPSRNYSILFSKDGKTAWSVAYNGDFYAMDVATKKVKTVFAIQAGFTPVLSPDGARVYVAGGAGIVAIDTSSETVVGTVPTGFVRFLSVSPDSQHVYATNGNAVVIVDAGSLTVQNQYAISNVYDIAALRDNQTAAIRVISNQSDGTGPILQLDLATGSTTTISNDPFTYFILSPNGKNLFALEGIGLAWVNIATGEVQQGESPIPLQTLCASPNGDKVYATTATGLVTIELFGHSAVNTTAGASPSACAVTPDSSRVWMANSAPNQIAVLDVATKKVSGVIEAPPNATTQMVGTPDGSKLFIGIAPGPGIAGNLAVLDTSKGVPDPQRLNLSPSAMAVSPDGSKLVVSSIVNFNENIAVVDVPTLTVSSSVVSARENTTNIAFSPDGSQYIIDGEAPIFGSLGLSAYNGLTNQFIVGQNVTNLGTGLVISPDGSTLYARNGFTAPKSIVVLDALTLLFKAYTDKFPVANGFVVSHDGGSLFAIGSTGTPGSYTLSRVSTASLAVTASVTLSGLPSDNSNMLALSPDGSQLYVSDAQQTWIVDTSDLSLAATLPVPSISQYQFGPQ